MNHEDAGGPRPPRRTPPALRRETHLHARRSAPARIALAALLGYLALLVLSMASRAGARPTSPGHELSGPSSTFDTGQLQYPYP